MPEEQKQSDYRRYVFSDLTIVSDFAFPELAEMKDGAAADVTVRKVDARWLTGDGAVINREWRMPDGSVWTTFQRVGMNWLVNFPDYARFLVSSDGSAVVCAANGQTEMSTVRHLLLNQILPLVLCARGRHTFHASAVEAEGRAAVFSGESGAGKSTLALHFAQNGYRFLSDDLVVFEQKDEGLQVVPSYPSLRVCRDSLEQANLTSPVVIASAEYSEKTRVLADDLIGFQDRRVILGAMYFLGDDADEITIQPVTGAESIIELVRASFVLDTTRKDYMRSHLHWASELAAMGRLFRLAYPRDFARLDETRAAILAHIRSLN